MVARFESQKSCIIVQKGEIEHLVELVTGNKHQTAHCVRRSC